MFWLKTWNWSIPKSGKRTAKLLPRGHHTKITSCFHLPLMAMNARGGEVKCGQSRAGDEESCHAAGCRLVPNAALLAQPTVPLNLMGIPPGTGGWNIVWMQPEPVEVWDICIWSQRAFHNLLCSSLLSSSPCFLVSPGRTSREKDIRSLV